MTAAQRLYNLIIRLESETPEYDRPKRPDGASYAWGFAEGLRAVREIIEEEFDLDS